MGDGGSGGEATNMVLRRLSVCLSSSANIDGGKEGLGREDQSLWLIGMLTLFPCFSSSYSIRLDYSIGLWPLQFF